MRPDGPVSRVLELLVHRAFGSAGVVVARRRAIADARSSETFEQLRGPIDRIDGAALPILVKDRPLPLGAALGHAAGGAVSDERRPVTNEDIATFVAEFANGAAVRFSISRVALGHPNGLGFEVFGTKAGAFSTFLPTPNSGTSTTHQTPCRAAGGG